MKQQMYGVNETLPGTPINISFSFLLIGTLYENKRTFEVAIATCHEAYEIGIYVPVEGSKQFEAGARRDGRERFCNEE